MKKILLLSATALGLAFFACRQNTPMDARASGEASGLQLLTADDPAWQYDNLRLYPVIAGTSPDYTIAALKTLAQGMGAKGFRIMERKQFGRTIEPFANELTVVNKSRDTILMLSGDVVTGGNQDRVIAQNDVILPGTIKNVPVFCVEQKRWQYYDETAPAEEKRVAAFRGFYNMASPQVRRAVYQGDQHSVWSAVDAVTSANQASSGTAAYAGLEQENDAKDKREACMHFFDGKAELIPNMTGVVAVANGQIIGVDIFANPDLFRREFKSLLHGYIAGSMLVKGSGTPDPETVTHAFDSVAALSNADFSPSEKVGKYVWKGHRVHLYRK